MTASGFKVVDVCCEQFVHRVARRGTVIVELSCQLGEKPLGIALGAPDSATDVAVYASGSVATGVCADLPIVGFPLESDTSTARRHTSVALSFDEPTRAARVT